jgi:hypothetical protein
MRRKKAPPATRSPNRERSEDALFNWEPVAQHEMIVFGSPGRVKEHMTRLLETSGGNYVLCAFAWGTLRNRYEIRVS